MKPGCEMANDIQRTLFPRRRPFPIIDCNYQTFSLDRYRGGPIGSPHPSFLKAASISFGVLFAAEWGDLSQLATAGLAARYDDPVSVFIGSWAAAKPLRSA